MGYLYDQIEEFEPRAQVADITFEHDAATGRTIPIIIWRRWKQTMSDRKYQDIDFVETDTETIESNLIALYENFVQQVPGRERYKVYPAVIRKGFSYHGLQISLFNSVSLSMKRQKRTCHVMQTVNTWTAWQNYSRTWKDCQQAQRLQCSVFIFQKAQKQSVIIPAGTRISFDGAFI